MNTLLKENDSKQIAIRSIAMFLCCMIIMSVVMLGTSGVAYCEDPVDPGTQIEFAINQMTNKIYVTMRRVITPIAICFLGLAGIQFLFGGRNGTEKARTTFIAAVIAIALVLFAPLIGQSIATWFAGSGSGNLSDYNPLTQ